MRHRSLDSATIASQSHNSQSIIGQSAAAPSSVEDAPSAATVPSATQSLAQIIEAKRKMAAERLQRYREGKYYL